MNFSESIDVIIGVTRAKEANQWSSLDEPICSVGQVYQGLKDNVTTNSL